MCAFVDRGICSGVIGDGSNLAEELRLPRKQGDKWYPYNPADFRAYVPRQRWFRTPNDAFMTGNFHVASSLVQKVLKLETFQWFQLLLASTYSGAFHPTAEGHAAIADSVAEKARAVLTKYGQGPDPEPQTEDYSQPPPPADEPGVALPDLQAQPPGSLPAAGPDTAASPSPAAPAAAVATPPGPPPEYDVPTPPTPPQAVPVTPPAVAPSPAPDTPTQSSIDTAPAWDGASVTSEPLPEAGSASPGTTATSPGTSIGEPDPGVGAPITDQ